MRLRQPVLAQERAEVAFEPASASAPRSARASRGCRSPGPARPRAATSLRTSASASAASRASRESVRQRSRSVRRGVVARDAPVGGHVLGSAGRACGGSTKPGAAPRLCVPITWTGAVPRARHRPQRGRALAAPARHGAGEQHHRHLAAARSDRPVAHGVHRAVKGDAACRPRPCARSRRWSGRPAAVAAARPPRAAGRDPRRHPKWSRLSCHSGVNRLHPADPGPARATEQRPTATKRPRNSSLPTQPQLPASSRRSVDRRC